MSDVWRVAFIGQRGQELWSGLIQAGSEAEARDRARLRAGAIARTAGCVLRLAKQKFAPRSTAQHGRC